ncbi:MAG: hypothetical protein E6K56_06485 [Ignavibacteria bacterium]|nr:MAG: hypothetical protein E6K56_06485 [Ignavibacteria bacterium]HYQ86280.1 hypothetical protein [Bacteroidota bacterium]
MNSMDEDVFASPGGDRKYRLDLKRCIIRECDGELAELSYYERNNWATVELQCNRCKKRFVVKVEI